MKKIILKLRSKPEHVRRQILHILVVTSVVIFFTLWLYSFKNHISDSDFNTKIKQDLKPFALLKDGIVESTKNLSWPLSTSDNQQ